MTRQIPGSESEPKEMIRRHATVSFQAPVVGNTIPAVASEPYSILAKLKWLDRRNHFLFFKLPETF